jgi:hypothetical protein
MKIKYLLVLVLLLETDGFASLSKIVWFNNIILKAGINTSFFVNETSSKPGYGYSLSYNKEFNLFKNSLISLGIGYSEREVVLENVTIRPYTILINEQINSYYWDIKGRIGYIEVPIMIRYEFSIKKVSVSPILGLSLSYPRKDLSKFEKKKFYRKTERDDAKYYDYNFEQETSFRSHGHEKVLCLGIRFQKNCIGLEMLYLINNRNKYDFQSLSTIHSRMYSIITQLTIHF